MSKQKLCEFKVMETAFDGPQPGLQSPGGPFQDTLLADVFQPSLLWFCDSSGAVVEVLGWLRSPRLSLFFVYGFTVLLYIPQLQTFWLPCSLSVVFFVLWVLVTFSFFPYPFSLLLIKSYVQTKEPESYLVQRNILICFYVESIHCPWRFALSLLC